MQITTWLLILVVLTKASLTTELQHICNRVLTVVLIYIVVTHIVRQSILTRRVVRHQLTCRRHFRRRRFRRYCNDWSVSGKRSWKMYRQVVMWKVEELLSILTGLRNIFGFESIVFEGRVL